MTIKELKKEKEELERFIGDAVHAALCRFIQKTEIPVASVDIEVHNVYGSHLPQAVTSTVRLNLDL